MSSKLVRYLIAVAMLVTVLASMAVSPALAADVTPTPTPTPTNTLDMVTGFPVYQGNSGDAFSFDVTMTWNGTGNKNFNLVVNYDLPKWQATILGGYPQKTISAIGLQPGVSQTVTVAIAPLQGVLPDPGNYKATLVATASTGDVTQSVVLTAQVVAKYLFAFYTNSGLLNTEATAGQDNHFALRIQSTSSAPVTNITFIAAQPTGWSVKYVPDSVPQVLPGQAYDIDLVITPPREVVPGDYTMTLTANTKETGNRTIDLRVTVLTPSIWGWVGVAIVLVVIAGLIFMFRQLGRR
jgi:uncharacterized membrane protein